MRRARRCVAIQAPPPKTLITPALFSRPPISPSPGEEGEQQDRTGEEVGMLVDKTLARALRRSATPAEKALWERLRGRQLAELKFLRQVPIGPFVADFCCRDLRLVVELDGEVHSTAQEVARDQERDAYLQGHNYIVLRFPNEQVLSDVESVLRRICEVALTAPSPWQRSQSTT